jgi:hypothetical protein
MPAQTNVVLATLYMRVPLGTPAQCVDLDSTWVAPAGRFIFSPTAGGSISPLYSDCGIGDIVIGGASCLPNEAPVVADIPDQTIAEGSSFATINLDDFVADPDNADNTLGVSISGSRVATISVPNPDWNGAETITFTATDPGTLFDSDSATFTVTAINDAPVAAGRLEFLISLFPSEATSQL